MLILWIITSDEPDDSIIDGDSLKIMLSPLKALKTPDWWQGDSRIAAVTFFIVLLSDDSLGYITFQLSPVTRHCSPTVWRVTAAFLCCNPCPSCHICCPKKHITSWQVRRVMTGKQITCHGLNPWYHRAYDRMTGDLRYSNVWVFYDRWGYMWPSPVMVS